MKKRLLLLSAAIIILILVGAAEVFATSPSVNIDGESVEYTDSTGYPFIDTNSRTQVPLRATMEEYGCYVLWDSYTQCITVYNDSQKVQLWIGRPYIMIGDYNGKYMDTSPMIIGGRTYLPIRPVLEAFGADVRYDSDTAVIDAYSPAYKLATHMDGTQEVEYEWEDPYNSRRSKTWYYTGTLDTSIYNYYRSVDRKNINGYTYYTKDTLDDYLIEDLVDTFREGAEDYDNNQLARLVIAFVQSFDYISDEDWTGTYDEYPKFPYETLYDHCGDCEDTSILLATLLKEMGFDVCLIGLPGHMAVGIKGGDSVKGSYFSYGSKKYFYIETTAEGWDVGEIPDEYAGSRAQLMFI